MDESSGSALLDHVSGLEFVFKQIKHDLSCAANTLDDAFDEAVSSSASCAPHPMKLLRRLERIEAKASQLQTDWQELEERRKVVLPNVRNDIEGKRTMSALSLCHQVLSLVWKLLAAQLDFLFVAVTMSYVGYSRARGEHEADESLECNCRLLRS